MSENKTRLSQFTKMQEEVVAKSEMWRTSRSFHTLEYVNYKPEEIEKIINSGSLEEQASLSYEFYLKDGLYKRIIWYYATLLTYSGLLIPVSLKGAKLSSQSTSKRYAAALNYLDKMNLKENLKRISQKVLTYGAYFGVLQSVSKDDFLLLDLPSQYCRSRFKDIHGNDVIEFNVGYFDTYYVQEYKEDALKAYPKQIAGYYRRFARGKESNPWYRIPAEISVYFALSDDARPFFLNVIPATVQYDDAVDTERERDLEEIRKIIVQKIPHLQDGTLLFEPDEAVEMHAGAVGMMRGNKNLSILTTYADVDAIISKTSSDNVNNSLEKMLQNVYAEAGTSVQIFSPTGTQALATSIVNDTSLMMILGDKYSRFITSVLNLLFANGTLSFKFQVLALTLYNKSDFITDSLKLAQSGYSFLLPAIASGLEPREFINVKNLENDVLDLGNIMKPLSSSYTQSNGEVGAPKKKEEDKAEKTIQNEKSLDHQGGS